ncbi:hypothetical protein GSY74_07100 [Sulfurovum sp. bin170]|uniref:hypothetical protein n=1 Tax=Sulfurovum sp. bin170 TaxID=2695268 RepID=UPI0013E059C9|nr:hypothetical protein [Sulfurovum sp. bin170]NEW61049.1 hypothetical protein [Sulfurovum sp. bin170]
MIDINTTVEPFTLNDQFGVEHNIQIRPKILICSFGKSTGKLISRYFDAQDKDYIRKHDIELMADVSGVPSLLRKTIIVPKMKKYSFDILLSDDKNFSKQFPAKEDSLTILKLENGVVKEIIFASDEDELKDAIEG